MVVYETISGNLPFHEDADLTVFVKVLEGGRPPRGVKFRNGLWRVLEQCWRPQPNDRPTIEDVLRYLEIFSHLSEPSPEVGEGMDADDDHGDSASGPSDVPNGASGTMKTEEGTTTSPDLSDIDDLHRSPRELPLYGRDGARRTTGKFYQEGGSDIWDKNGAASVPSRDEADSPGNLQNPVSHLAFVVRCVRDPQRPVQAPCSRTAEKDAIQPFS
jgi:hypothetical protein